MIDLKALGEAVSAFIQWGAVVTAALLIVYIGVRNLSNFGVKIKDLFKTDEKPAPEPVVVPGFPNGHARDHEIMKQMIDEIRIRCDKCNEEVWGAITRLSEMQIQQTETLKALSKRIERGDQHFDSIDQRLSSIAVNVATIAGRIQSLLPGPPSGQ